MRRRKKNMLPKLCEAFFWGERKGLIKHLSVKREIETFRIRLVFILFFWFFTMCNMFSTLRRRLEYDYKFQVSGQLTWRWIKTTDPRSLHVPPWRSTWSMRRIWRKRMPLKTQCREGHHSWSQMLLLLFKGWNQNIVMLPDSRRSKHLTIGPHTQHNDWGDDHYQICKRDIETGFWSLLVQ